MGQHQCPKFERQFARSDSLRWHQTSDFCSRNNVKNEDITVSEESDAEISSRHQKEDIFGKYEHKEYGILKIWW